MKIKLDAIITAILVVCALVTTTILIHRELWPSASPRLPIEDKPVLIARWRDSLDKGIRLGPVDAPVQLVEFADFECPFCASFHTTLKTVREQYRAQVSVVYVHFPLPMHRFALPAARASECAADQDRFEAIYDQLFEGQNSFGLKSWSEYAKAAGVVDLSAFDDCVKKTGTIARVAEGVRVGKELDVQGTPTVIVNGWKLGHPPSVKELDGMIKAVLAGKSPVDGNS